MFFFNDTPRTVVRLISDETLFLVLFINWGIFNSLLPFFKSPCLLVKYDSTISLITIFTSTTNPYRNRSLPESERPNYWKSTLVGCTGRRSPMRFRAPTSFQKEFVPKVTRYGR